MKNHPYDYTVLKEQDHNAFVRICQNLQERVKGLHKERYACDMDGDETQVYLLDGKQIVVRSDFWVGAVYVQSDIPLSIDLLNVA